MNIIESGIIDKKINVVMVSTPLIIQPFNKCGKNYYPGKKKQRGYKEGYLIYVSFIYDKNELDDKGFGYRCYTIKNAKHIIKMIVALYDIFSKNHNICDQQTFDDFWSFLYEHGVRGYGNKDCFPTFYDMKNYIIDQLGYNKRSELI